MTMPLLPRVLLLLIALLVPLSAEDAPAPAPAVEAPPQAAPASPPVGGERVHPTIKNANAQVDLSSYRASMLRMRLLTQRPLALPKWRSKNNEQIDTHQPLAVLDAFNPVRDMNCFVEGANLPLDPAQEGEWAWHQTSASEGEFTLERDGLAYAMRYRMDDRKPQVHVSFRVLNHSGATAKLKPELRPLNGIHQDDPTAEAGYEKLAYHIDGQLGKLQTKAFPPPAISETVTAPGEIDYVALKSRFFAAWWTPEGMKLGGALVPLSIRAFGAEGFATTTAAGTEHQALIEVAYSSAAGIEVAPGAELEIDWAIAVSAMTKEELAKLDPIERELEYTDAYYWFFKSIANIMTWALGAIAKLVHWYGLAVIILVFVIKLLLHRFTHKQYESTMKMQKLAPELKYLQEQYKNDRQKMAMKQMELWKKHGVNPLAGCLPLLVQVPIFMALYQSFSHSAELRGQSFLWIRDLTLPDQVWFLGFHWPVIGSLATVNPLPILYIAVTVWMSMLQKPPTGGDPQQEQMFKMMRWLPVIFGVIFYQMPSGLVLYFTVQAVLSTIEIKLVKRRLGMA
jgi:YidC/Oxa1 family membrane protein insertase